MRRDLVHPDRQAAIIAQNEVALVLTKPKATNGDGTVTGPTTLAAQTVRISYDSRVVVVEGAAGKAPVLNAQLYAVAGTDIAEGYTFTHEGNRFRVTDVVPVAGGIHAFCMAIG